MFRSTNLLRSLPKSLPLRASSSLPVRSAVAASRRSFAVSSSLKMDPAHGDFNGYFGGEPAGGEEHDEFRMPGRVFVQGPAPNWKATLVKEGEFSDAKLTDYRGKWLVLLFYPMDFTFVCPTEILSFDRALPKFKELNTEVIGVSTDSEYSHLAWSNLPRKEGGLGPNLTIPLLSDKNHEMSKDYGVLIPEAGISLRGLFIIDPTGTVRQITINDLPVGRSVEETIRLIKAFQFTDEHGEVCPADWSPENSDTIKADPKASKEYFGKQK